VQRDQRGHKVILEQLVRLVPLESPGNRELREPRVQLETQVCLVEQEPLEPQAPLAILGQRVLKVQRVLLVT